MKVDVPEEFNNVPLNEWAVGAMVVMSMVAGNLGTPTAWSDKQIDEAFSKLFATAPDETARTAQRALTNMVLRAYMDKS